MTTELLLQKILKRIIHMEEEDKGNHENMRKKSHHVSTKTNEV
jgi:hypothetical protein